MSVASPIPADALRRDLAGVLGSAAVLPDVPAAYRADATQVRGLGGRADVVVRPGDAAEVAALLSWCYEHEVPITPRGGGSGYAGGAVPDGGVVCSLERLDRVRSVAPLQWRMEVEAGVATGTVRRLARESGLVFPPDPGAWEQSLIGGNIATNAGGPHAFKYGVTGAWVLGLEAVLAPGEVVRVGGPVRKDVAGYDLTALLVGSEGTLGIVTAAWLRLMPAPEAALPVAAAFSTIEAGAEAMERVLGSGVVPAALEYLDGGAVAAAAATFPGEPPGEAAFLVIAEADGTADECARVREELLEALRPDAIAVHAPQARGDVEALWRWRDGVSLAVVAQRGGKLSEDIVVPVERLGEAVRRTLDIGAAHGLEACSWGHAGDGNLHSTFLLDPTDPAQVARAEGAAADLFALARELGGSVSGEHGIGLVKRAHVEAGMAPGVVRLQREVKRAFDPKGLLNPGKKVP